jgi:hypothetical protein
MMFVLFFDLVANLAGQTWSGADFFAVCIGSPVDVVSSIRQLYQ